MYVYILKSIGFKKHYVGMTNNVNRRFFEHNSGLVKKTKFYKPFLLVHVELAVNRNNARSLEKYFKSGYGREIIEEIENG